MILPKRFLVRPGCNPLGLLNLIPLSGRLLIIENAGEIQGNWCLGA
jgi:hypothetical protein